MSADETLADEPYAADDNEGTYNSYFSDTRWEYVQNVAIAAVAALVVIVVVVLIARSYADDRANRAEVRKARIEACKSVTEPISRASCITWAGR